MEVSPRIRRGDVLEVAVRVAGEVRSLRALRISGNARKWVVEGNGNTLQYSCLENSMDRRAWQAAVYRVAELDTTKQLATKEVSGKSREDAGSAVDDPEQTLLQSRSSGLSRCGPTWKRGHGCLGRVGAVESSEVPRMRDAWRSLPSWWWMQSCESSSGEHLGSENWFQMHSEGLYTSSD